MTKTKEKKEPTLRQERGDLKAELEKNIGIETMRVLQRRPWTFVEFVSFYKGPRGGKNEVKLWGMSKVCIPDVWNEGEGINKACDRAIAWAVKQIMPPVVE
jgi:hypothetical protein